MIYRNTEFLAEESCGRCAPCRDGSEAMLEILGRLTRGEGGSGDIRALEDLSSVMSVSSLCGLGQTASIPVRDTLKYFRKEYESRIEQSKFLRTLP
jgi:NADH:ubiquinone oxidoreductase subunit F (NADH-binding)